MNNRLIRLECLRIALSKGYADDALRAKVDEYTAIVLDAGATAAPQRRQPAGSKRKTPDTSAES